uniref:Kinesin-like protein n=1 Tax=Arcella intermedia TaxID=1963864 RepID=A0A6B2KZD2_9EUKA
MEPEAESCLYEAPASSSPDTTPAGPAGPLSKVRLSKDRQTVHDFAFDYVFPATFTQREVFDSIGRPFVDRLFSIPNDQSVIFAFGTSSSGKTFTVQGKLGESEPRRKKTESRGLLPRLLESLFASIPRDILVDAQQTDEMEVTKDDDVYIFAVPASVLTKKIKISISFYEIYNEKITDLLSPPSANTTNNPYLTLQDDPSGNVMIKDLSEMVVTDIDSALKYLELGLKNRAVQATKVNPDSSRSHSVFDIKLSFYDSNGIEAESKLSVVDLAGSERLSKTQNTGERTREASNINKSLMILGRCIEILRRNQSNPKSVEKVPYRDSKLTHIFRNCLSGVQGKISMIITINPKMLLFEENIHVLKFAAIAKTVNVETAKKVTKTVRFEKDTSNTTSSSASGPGNGSLLGVGTKVDIPSVRRPFRTAQTQKAPVDNSECVFTAAQVDMFIEKLESFESILQDYEKRLAQKEAEVRVEVTNEMAQEMHNLETTLVKNFQQRIDALESYYKQQMGSLQDGFQKRITELELNLKQKEEANQKQQQTINNLKLTISKMKPAAKDQKPPTASTLPATAPTAATTVSTISSITTSRNVPLKDISEPTTNTNNKSNIMAGPPAQPIKKILASSSSTTAVPDQNAPAFTPIARRSQRRNEKNG